MAILLLAGCGVLGAQVGTATASTLPSGFQEATVITGLSEPIAVRFATDGRVFVAEKSGLIKEYDNLSDTTPTTVADLRTNVYNLYDRGMLGFELDPNFPANPYVYVLYAHDAAIGGTAPRWGTPGTSTDNCPVATGGCMVSGRLSRLQLAGNVQTGPEQVLVEDWCQQYSSHSVGDIAFGADGALYASGGDGASFEFADYGQEGNPCGDPPGGVGGAMTPPTAEGGALRAQDIRSHSSAPAPPGVPLIMRPNADVTSQWVVGGGGPAWDALDDNVAQPASVPVEKFIFEGTLNKVTEVALTNPALNGATPTSGKAWWYGNLPANATLKVDAIWGGAVQATTSVAAGASSLGYAWRSLSVTPPDQAAADDLRLRFTITKGSTSSANIFAAYFELTPSGSGGGGPTDPTGLNGSVIRVNPATGAGLPDNPNASSTDPNERRMVAHGFRNPFRFTTRPGTNELWIGDVGWGTWEEIDRLANPTADATVDNFGWPCYEGAFRQGGYDSADLNLCESLYAAPNVVSPYFAYDHSAKVVSGESCPSGSSSLTGAAFYGNGPYGAAYQGAFFFSDYSRDCIWAMQAGTNGLPDPSKIVTFASGAANPVDIVVGPDGNLYYVDIEGGAVRQVSFTAANETPTAVAEATPTTGSVPLTVQFDATASSDPDIGDTLTYAWDLDADGLYNDSTAAQPTWVYSTAGVYLVGLRVTDPAGHPATATVTVTAGNTRPVANITAPDANTLWRVGQQISFSGTGTDAESGTLGASRLSWQLNMEHCPSNCHTHFIQTFPGVAGGSFISPDHEYPSYMTLKLTVTDPGGLSDTDVVRLDPRTVGVTLKSVNPTGLQLSLNSITATSPFTLTLIQGSVNSISAPSPQTVGPSTYSWVSWSDGGARTHNITASANRTYKATFNGPSGGAAAALARQSLKKCLTKAKRSRHKGKKRKRCYVKFST